MLNIRRYYDDENQYRLNNFQPWTGGVTVHFLKYNKETR